MVSGNCNRCRTDQIQSQAKPNAGNYLDCADLDAIRLAGNLFTASTRSIRTRRSITGSLAGAAGRILHPVARNHQASRWNPASASVCLNRDNPWRVHVATTVGLNVRDLAVISHTVGTICWRSEFDSA